MLRITFTRPISHEFARHHLHLLWLLTASSDTKNLRFNHILYKKLIPHICSEPAMKPASCVTKSDKGMNNYLVCAFSSSFSCTLHLVCLKPMDPALFNFSFSASHVLPGNISASLQLLCTNHVWSGDKDLAQHLPKRWRRQTLGKAQLYLFSSDFSIHSHSSDCS